MDTEEIALVHIHTALHQLGYRLQDCDEMPEPYQRLVWMLAARIQSGVSDDLTEFFESMMFVTRHHMDQQVDHMDDYANRFKQQHDELRGYMTLDGLAAVLLSVLVCVYILVVGLICVRLHRGIVAKNSLQIRGAVMDLVRAAAVIALVAVAYIVS